MVMLLLSVISFICFGLFALEFCPLGLLLIESKLEVSKLDIVLFLECFDGGLQATDLIGLQGEQYQGLVDILHLTLIHKITITQPKQSIG